MTNHEELFTSERIPLQRDAPSYVYDREGNMLAGVSREIRPGKPLDQDDPSVQVHMLHVEKSTRGRRHFSEEEFAERKEQAEAMYSLRLSLEGMVSDPKINAQMGVMFDNVIVPLLFEAGKLSEWQVDYILGVSRETNDTALTRDQLVRKEEEFERYLEESEKD